MGSTLFERLEACLAEERAELETWRWIRQSSVKTLEIFHFLLVMRTIRLEVKEYWRYWSSHSGKATWLAPPGQPACIETVSTENMCCSFWFGLLWLRKASLYSLELFPNRNSWQTRTLLRMTCPDSQFGKIAPRFLRKLHSESPLAKAAAAGAQWGSCAFQQEGDLHATCFLRVRRFKNLLSYGGLACSTHCRGGRIETMRTFAWAFYGFRHISQMETAGWGLRIAISIGNWCWRLGSDLHLTWWISVRSRGFLAIVRGSEPLIGFCSKPLAGWSEGRESSKAECFLHVTVVKFPPCGNVAWAIWQGHQKKKTLTSRPHQKRNTERDSKRSNQPSI